MRIARKAAGVVPVLLVILLGIALLVLSVTSYRSGDPVGRRTWEKQSIQTAMDTLMADNSIMEVEAGPYAVQDWISYPIVPGLGLVPLTDYLEEDASEYFVYFYCWDTRGNITQQEESGLVRCSQQK